MMDLAKMILTGLAGLALGTIAGVLAITFIPDGYFAIEVAVIFVGITLGSIVGVCIALARSNV